MLVHNDKLQKIHLEYGQYFLFYRDVACGVSLINIITTLSLDKEGICHRFLGSRC